MIDVSKVAYNVYAVLQDGTRLNVTPAVMDPVSYTHLTLPTICSV